MNVQSTAPAAANPVAATANPTVPVTTTSPRPPLPGEPVKGAKAPAERSGTPDSTNGTSPVDRIELSSKGLKLALSRTVEEAVRETSPEPAPQPEPPKAEPEEPIALPGKESTWESERTAKLDRLEVLVRQGQYKIDPFMLDEIAVRMARLMV